ncbi:MAG: tetratricopeptide repeat protein [Gammaproteobacteria bacterium]|nr:tetratricopeptide repeat protein [Gammaproteobacteria bacterium]MCW8986257.1 tetratricopeptide repeat protein [Gammaproteobacteria bacterium]
MIKKRQNLTRLLILVSIFSLQMGCAARQSNNDTENSANNSNINKQNDQKSAIPDSSSESSSDQSAQEESAAAATPEQKTSTELSSETFYYLFSAEIAAQRGQIGLSAALYSKAAEVTRDPGVAKQATRIAYYARDDERAIAAASLWNELEPENLEARQVLAALLVRIGKTKDAAEHFEYVLNNGKHTERQGFMLITSLLSKEKDKQAALTVMNQLLSTRKNNPDALYAYSQLAFHVGDLDDAARVIKKVIQLQPQWTDAHILQSNIFVRQGYKAHAIEVLRQTVAAQSDNSKLRMFYARNLVDAKQFDEAAKQFALLTEDEKLQHEARYALGLLTLQMNKPKQAVEYFSQLLKDKKRVIESQYYLAQSYELQNELDKSISAYKKVRDNQYGFEAELRIAYILAKQGHIQEARRLLQNMSPDSLDKELRVYITEGEVLNSAKQYNEAFKLYTEALQQLTDNNRLLYARALTAEKLGKIDLAVKDLKSIVKREPKNAQALNALGYTLIDKTQRIEEGLKYVQRALKLEPDDPAIHDSMGWAYYRLGQYDEALKYLKRAFEKLKDAEIAAHLGEVLWVAGEHAAAKEVWNAALEQTPNDDLLLNVMQKFSE